MNKLDCDICGESCLHFFSKEFPEESSPEFATLEATWGYFSNQKDMCHDKCIMCEKCYDKVTAFIMLLGGKVRRNQYELGNGDDVGQIPFHNDFFNPLFTCGQDRSLYNEDS